MKIYLLTPSLVFLSMLSIFNPLKSQSINENDSNKTNLKFTIGSDIVSRFIWRGIDYGNSPAIQPSFSLTTHKFEVGCWGSTATNSNYTEIDLYAKYTINKIAFIITDYFVPTINGGTNRTDNRFFNFNDKTTSHTIEASLAFKGDEKFPLSLLCGVYFYGNDKRWGYNILKDSTEKTYFSTYAEAAYTFSFQENTVDVFIGITPSAGAYGNKFGVVNVGIAGNRKIKISENFELPIKASIIFNPLTSNAFFVFGITL